MTRAIHSQYVSDRKKAKDMYNTVSRYKKLFSSETSLFGYRFFTSFHFLVIWDFWDWHKHAAHYFRMVNIKSAARDSMSSLFLAMKQHNTYLESCSLRELLDLWNWIQDYCRHGPTLVLASTTKSTGTQSIIYCAVDACCLRCSVSLPRGWLFHAKLHQYIFTNYMIRWYSSITRYGNDGTLGPV